MESVAGRNNSMLTKADGKFILLSGPPVADRRFLAASAALLSKDADVTKRSEGSVIKNGGPREISHRERKMMQHGIERAREFYSSPSQPDNPKKGGNDWKLIRGRPRFRYGVRKIFPLYGSFTSVPLGKPRTST